MGRVNNNSGYTGSGFANTSNSNGNGIDWSIGGNSGSYTFRWRYANGSSTDRTGVLSINGSNVSTRSFPGTGSWTSWTTTSVTVSNVSSGTKSIRLQANQSSGLSNIDYLEVTGPGVYAAGCSKSAPLTLNDNKETMVNLYPNPVTNLLNIEVSKDLSDAIINIYDNTGRLIKTQNMEGISYILDMKDLSSGIYLLKISNQSKTLFIKRVAKK